LFAPFEWFACSGTQDITVASYQKPQSIVCLLHFSIKPRKDKIILESACGA
jgi:hypothetical protein